MITNPNTESSLKQFNTAPLYDMKERLLFAGIKSSIGHLLIQVKHIFTAFKNAYVTFR